MVITPCSLFLSRHREVAYTFHVTNYSSQVVDVGSMTLRTFLEIVLADMSAAVADCVRDVEREIVTSFLCSNTKKLGILSL